MDKLRLRLLEKISKHKLLDSDLEKERDECKVVTLPTKGYPEGYFLNANDQEDGTSPEFKEDHYPHEELITKCGNDSSFALYRKAFPHCLYGMMLLKNNNDNQVGFNDYSLRDRTSFLDIARKFAIFTERNNIYPNISWTYDPFTRDRKSGQSQLWYHMHLNSHTEETKSEILNKAKPLGEIEDKKTKRSFIEEFSIMSSFVLHDYLLNLDKSLAGKIEKPFEINGLPNLGVLYNENWDYLSADKFNHDLDIIHSSIVYLYELFRNILYTGERGIWQRPHRNSLKLTREDFEWMTDETFLILDQFISNLDSELLNKNLSFFKSNPKSEITSFLYPLAGASYCISITRRQEDNKLLLSVRPQMFSDTGGAGLHYVFGTTVKLKRGSETYTEKELADKYRFENDFKSFLEGNINN